MNLKNLECGSSLFIDDDLSEVSIAQTLADFQARIQRLRCDLARERGVGVLDLPEVCLIAVSKSQPLGRIHEALAAGHRVFGENRVQEACARWGDLRGQYPDLVLHFIGHLQTNKVREAVGLFDVIHTLDRPSLVETLAEEMNRQGRFLPCFIQVNTGAEPQKHGVLPSDLPDFYALCQKSGLEVRGLMAIPPVNEPCAFHFALLAQYAKLCGLQALSMGMSDDFEKAIAFGATHIRIGTALFGARPSAKGTHDS